MATYVKQVWADNDATKPLSAARMNNIEAGIASDPATQVLSPDGVSMASGWQHFTTKPLTPPSKVVFRFNGATGFTGTGVTDDTTTKLFGDRTVKVTSSNAIGRSADSPTFAAQDWSKSIIRVWMKVDNAANFAQGIMYLTMANGAIVSTSIGGNLQNGEWSCYTVNRALFGVNAGTPDWTAITRVSLQTNPGASVTLNTWFGGVDLIPDNSAAYPNGVMIVEFDDAYAGQLTNAVPVLGPRGIPATFNVISERITSGVAGITAAQLRDLQDRHGWSVSCHAYATAAHGSTVNPVDVMEADFQRQKHWLHANGLHSGANHLALCPGTGSPVAAGLMMDAIQRSFESVRVNSGPWETSIPGDPLRLRSKLFVNDTNATLQQHIDKAAGAGGAYILTMHDVIAGSTNGTSNGLQAIAANNLASVLDYAAGKGMVFRTRADYIAGR